MTVKASYGSERQACSSLSHKLQATILGMGRQSSQMVMQCCCAGVLEGLQSGLAARACAPADPALLSRPSKMHGSHLLPQIRVWYVQMRHSWAMLCSSDLAPAEALSKAFEALVWAHPFLRDSCFDRSPVKDSHMLQGAIFGDVEAEPSKDHAVLLCWDARRVGLPLVLAQWRHVLLQNNILTGV